MYKLFSLMVVMAVVLAACSENNPQVEATPTEPVVSVTATVQIPGAGSALTSSEQLTSATGQQAVCFKEELPPNYLASAAVQGMKSFAAANNITLRYVYFPVTCQQQDIEKDVRLLFFGDTIKDDEIALMLLEPFSEGTLGKLYMHLAKYNFWAMGPEDYPWLLDKRVNMETNIIIFRVDRMNGEGTEGNGLLELTMRMGEHEYIHTVQGRNNPMLAELMWTDPVYRYFIENYANFRNNFGKMYYESSYTLLMLIQFLDSLNAKNTLEPKAVAILQERGMDVETFLQRDLVVYNQHFRAHIEQVGGKPYLERVSTGRINPVNLVEMAGSGDIEAYEVIRRLYDQNIGEYDQKFYGPNKEEYMPSFDELFKLD